MKGTLHIEVDLEAGEVRLGVQRVRLIPPATQGAFVPSRSSGDVFHLNNPSGPVVRALNFEERSLLLAEIPESEIASSIAHAALVTPGDASELLRVAVSLALAGGGEQSPSFSDCTVFAAQQDGWDRQRVGETLALLVDRMCSKLNEQSWENGWQRIIFQEAEPDLETLVSLMAENLRQRSASGAVDSLKSAALAMPDKSKPVSEHSPFQFWSSLVDGAKTHKANALNTQAANFPSDLQRLEMSQSASIAFKQHRASLPQSDSSTLPVARRNPESKLPSTAPSQISISRTIPSSRPPTPLGTPEASGRSTPEASVRSTPLRVSARVMPLTTDDPAQSRAGVVAKTPVVNDRDDKPQIAYSPADHIGYSPADHFGRSTRATKQAATTNESKSSLSQIVSAPLEQPAAFQCWLAELAALLEAECDMRGIDP